MIKNILLIGKNSFITTQFKLFPKKNIRIKIISFEEFKKKNIKNIKAFNYIINTTSNQNYIKKKYLPKNDHDLYIAKKIKNFNVVLVFLSSRKVYKKKNNPKETDQLLPKENYSINKVITEKKLQIILEKKLLILRISNIVGLENRKKRKLHLTFVNSFFKNIKKNQLFYNSEIYKDFLSSKMFVKLIISLLKKNARGIYNISIGKKVYLKKIINWLNFYNNKKNFKIKNKIKNVDSFYLNNFKLRKKTNTKITLKELEKDCKDISYKFFIKN